MSQKSNSKKTQPESEEQARLQELYDYHILDTPDEENFDQIARIASVVFDVPIAAISLVDWNRQWFKARVGLEAEETARDVAFCHHTIQSDEILLVPNALEDERFQHNPLVTGEMGIRFYAGAPLISPNRHRLGALCVIDQKPRQFTEDQKKILKMLSQQVLDQMELKRIGRSLLFKSKELEQVQERLQEQTQFLNQIVNNLPLGFTCKDAKNNFSFTMWNKTAAENSGVSPEQVIGKNDFDLLPKEQAERIREKHEITLKNENQIHEYEEVIDFGKSGKRFLRTREFPIKNKKGENQYILGLSEDVTEKKETQILLMQSSKMSSLGEMAAGIAHEINNPLAIIRARSQMAIETIETGGFTPQAALEWAKKIEETAVRISKIIHGLRTFARDGGSDPFVKTPLTEIISNVIELSSGKLKNKSISFDIQSLDPALFLECRSVQIGQVLINLINNSVDAIQEQAEKWIRIEVRELESDIEMRFSDSGSGIPREIQDRIMHPFFTTKEVGKGTGLGLSISKGIIESHHGALTLDSQSPNTTFVIRLPRWQKRAGSKAA